MHFVKKFRRIIRQNSSHLCIGLDTDIKKIPSFLSTSVNPAFEFNNLIIEATNDIVCAFKLNSAFYESMGDNGFNTMRQTVKNIPEGIITISDAKRGDIENTSELYARTFFDDMNFDAITLQPYMGTDSVRPFLRRKNKFVFMLALTSNYGASDFQFLKVGKIHLYEAVIERSLEWSSQKIGFVVGANHDRELKKIMTRYENVPILIPGIGSQKNSLEKLSKAISHNMFLINQSRSIIYSANEAKDAERFKELIRINAIKARDDINNLISSSPSLLKRGSG